MGSGSARITSGSPNLLLKGRGVGGGGGGVPRRSVRVGRETTRTIDTGADPGFLKGGRVHIRSTSKKGGARWGSNFGPNVKKPTSWHKRGVQTPWTPPWIRH